MMTIAVDSTAPERPAASARRSLWPNLQAKQKPRSGNTHSGWPRSKPLRDVGHRFLVGHLIGVDNRRESHRHVSRRTTKIAIPDDDCRMPAERKVDLSAYVESDDVRCFKRDGQMILVREQNRVFAQPERGVSKRLRSPIQSVVAQAA